ncbi:hypothetical protein [Acidiphilium sp.]|uniref:hypothetical protein n=1 Tax=Acidiphilium sp. TaxID=527 RepID=UPI0025875D97|nr:hypothetical protein [Acidiphilium sp.]
MASKQKAGRRPQDGKEPNQAAGMFRRAFRWGVNPNAIFGTDEIRMNARYIGDMWSGLQKERSHRRRRLTPDGKYDVVAMAFDYGTSPDRILMMIANSRAISARASRIYLISGIMLLLYWAYRVIVSPVGLGNIFYVLLVLAMALWFLVLSFFKAMENWRLRNQRPGTFTEFLHTDDSWWPR